MKNPVFKDEKGWWFFQHHTYTGGPFMTEDAAWNALREYIGN